MNPKVRRTKKMAKKKLAQRRPASRASDEIGPNIAYNRQ
jgi:hypothetical protein